MNKEEKTRGEKLFQFRDRMAFIEKYNKEFEIANKAVQELMPNSHPVIDMGANLLDGYIDLLQDIYNDKNEWISYFVYDCNYGANPMKIVVDGKETLLKTVDDVFYLIHDLW